MIKEIAKAVAIAALTHLAKTIIDEYFEKRKDARKAPDDGKKSSEKVEEAV